jgi:LPXTG-motif cell wall-anchored protein
MCLGEASTESAAVAEESPQTGTALYVVGALMMTLTILGWVLRGKSKELW